jgi:hypothetical protein
MTPLNFQWITYQNQQKIAMLSLWRKVNKYQNPKLHLFKIANQGFNRFWRTQNNIKLPYLHLNIMITKIGFKKGFRKLLDLLNNLASHHLYKLITQTQSSKIVEIWISIFSMMKWVAIWFKVLIITRKLKARDLLKLKNPWFILSWILSLVVVQWRI